MKILLNKHARDLAGKVFIVKSDMIFSHFTRTVETRYSVNKETDKK